MIYDFVYFSRKDADKNRQDPSVILTFYRFQVLRLFVLYNKFLSPKIYATHNEKDIFKLHLLVLKFAKKNCKNWQNIKFCNFWN